MVRKGARLNPKNRSQGALPLQVAVHPLLRTLELAKLLVALGAKVNLKDRLGQTALWEAVRTCNYRAVKFLIKNGADIHVRARENGFDSTLYQRSLSSSRVHKKEGKKIVFLLQKLMVEPQRELRNTEY